MAKQVKRLYRSKKDKMIGGVCAGLADYFEVDPSIVRLIWAFLILGGVGLVAYIVCWIIIPEK